MAQKNELCIQIISFKLNENISDNEFISASEKMQNDLLSKQNGYISRSLIKNGDEWVNLIFWDNEESSKNTSVEAKKNESFLKYSNLINSQTTNYKQFYLVKAYRS